jgi:uncharacterized small protein (DUF1192 family)
MTASLSNNVPTNGTAASPRDEGHSATVEALCRALGAPNPEGALRQVNVMKRTLRRHHRVRQRLAEYDVDDLSGAVVRIATLTREVERLRAQQRRRAERRLTVIEALLDRLDALWSDASEAAPSKDPPPRGDSSPPAAPVGDASALESALDLADALGTELDELRLELWLATDDPDEATSGASAADLLDRLADALADAQRTSEQLRAAYAEVRTENDRLRRDAERLRTTVNRQRARLEQLTAPSGDGSAPSRQS